MHSWCKLAICMIEVLPSWPLSWSFYDFYIEVHTVVLWVCIFSFSLQQVRQFLFVLEKLKDGVVVSCVLPCTNTGLGFSGCRGLGFRVLRFRAMVQLMASSIIFSYSHFWRDSVRWSVGQKTVSSELEMRFVNFKHWFQWYESQKSTPFLTTQIKAPKVGSICLGNLGRAQKV